MDAGIRSGQRAALPKEAIRLAKDSADRKEIGLIAVELDGLMPAWTEN